MNRAQRRRVQRAALSPDQQSLDLGARARSLTELAAAYHRIVLAGGVADPQPLSDAFAAVADDLTPDEVAHLLGKVVLMAGGLAVRAQDAAGAVGSAPVDLASLGHRSPFLSGRAAAPGRAVA